VHTGHPIDIHEHRRSEYGMENEYGQTGISEEVYAKIITSMQNRENQCKRKLAYNYCSQGKLGKVLLDPFILVLIE
jgi:hypothetical protein